MKENPKATPPAARSANALCVILIAIGLFATLGLGLVLHLAGHPPDDLADLSRKAEHGVPLNAAP